MPKTGSREPLAHDRRTFMKAGGVATAALFAEGPLARPSRAHPDLPSMAALAAQAAPCAKQALFFRFFDRA